MSYRTLLVSTALTAVIGTSASAHFIGVGGNNSIDGSLCVGGDCVAEESFGFDTLRLKENNLRMNFVDTSSAASFPTNDWRIVINDSANGGASYFGVEDSNAGRIPFRVTAGARNNALFVDAQGDVGIGTSTPATDIDIKVGDSPTVRLQQDGSSGFQAQTWDMAGNETNFFIRDASNGSVLPFRIRPSAPTNSLFIDTDGDIGMGTASPDASLHVETSDSTGKLLIEDTGATFNVQVELIKAGTPRMRFDDSTVDAAPPSGTNLPAEWDIGLDGSQNFLMRSVATNANVFTLTSAGDLTIAGAITTTGGTCGGGCDLVFDPDYDMPSIEEHASLMWANKHLPNVGPTLENAPINLTDKLGRMLNELEHAHIYIEELHSRIAVLEDTLLKEAN